MKIDIEINNTEVVRLRNQESLIELIWSKINRVHPYLKIILTKFDIMEKSDITRLIRCEVELPNQLEWSF
jgi:hypothetical protein